MEYILTIGHDFQFKKLQTGNVVDCLNCNMWTQKQHFQQE